MPRGKMTAPTKNELRETIEALTKAIEDLVDRVEKVENKQSLWDRILNLRCQRDEAVAQLKEAS